MDDPLERVRIVPWKVSSTGSGVQAESAIAGSAAKGFSSALGP